MIRLLLLIVFLIFNHLSFAQKSKPFTITLEATSDYCYGARPNAKMMEELSIPKKVQNREFLWVGDTKKDSVMMKTNEEGIVKIRLMKGSTYQVFRKEKVQKDLMIDSKSCEEWVKSADFKVVAQKPYLKNIKFHFNCSPCGPRKQ